MKGDKEAIRQAVERHRRLEEHLADSNRAEIAFREELHHILTSLFERGETPLDEIRSPRLRAYRIRALRFVLRRVGRAGFEELKQMLVAKSTSLYRLEFRRREDRELPRHHVAERQAIEREARDVEYAARMYELMDEGNSRYQAIEQMIAEGFEIHSPAAFEQKLKSVRKSAKARRYAHPLAPAVEMLMGTVRQDDIAEPLISVERMTRNGRPKKG